MREPLLKVVSWKVEKGRREAAYTPLLKPAYVVAYVVMRQNSLTAVRNYCDYDRCLFFPLSSELFHAFVVLTRSFSSHL